MTAEVAVINRAAVALAADSAVTLSGGDPSANVRKIFQNENKIFEISATFPVGLMIYNATGFFDIPWEVIIKDFRHEQGRLANITVFDWAEKFRNYVFNHPIFRPNERRQRDFLRELLTAEYSRLLQSWVEEMRPLLFERKSKSRAAQFPAAFTRHLEERVLWHESHAFYEGFDEEFGTHLLNDTYKEDAAAVKREVLGEYPFQDSDHHLVARLARGVISRATRGWFTTGVVFAGYGTDELFPSLLAAEIGGAVGDRLRWRETRRVDIDRLNTTAEIIPFAQREAVDTLLFGRANLFEKHVIDYFSNATGRVANGLLTELRIRGQKRKDFSGRIDAAIKEVANNFCDHHSVELREAFARDTLDSVRHMPKPDLAAFAESLVTVTSMMRKASIGPETVGGPIDVAVISRHEGFIWVRRKHYFSPDLNRRYLWRAFAGQQEGGDVAAVE